MGLREESAGAPGPVRAQQSYRHEAFLWRRPEDYTRGMVEFVLDGLDAGEAVMAAVLPEHAQWLGQSLGARADQVEFVDITEMGRNPARIIPAWQKFVETHSGYGRPARGIGEPIWPERSADELVECQLHEALLNLAVDPDIPFWLVCPYDEEQLAPEVIAEAYRSHPVVSTADSYQGSPRYVGRAHAHALFTTSLPELTAEPVQLVVGAGNTDDVPVFVTLQAVRANLASDQVVHLADAVRRLVLRSLTGGASEVTVRLWHQSDGLVCEVADVVCVDDYLIGRRRPSPSGDDSVWQANLTHDLVQVRSGEGGTTIRLHQRS